MDAALQNTLERVRAALAHQAPLRIRGGGSKDFYTSGVQGEVLETSALRGVLSYEPSELVVTVRAGTLLAELEATLAQEGQYLAFEPPHFADAGARATVGGMVAAGWSGPARASVGAVRDFVLGVEIMNGKAELLRFGGTVMKNVAGYDVSRLMAGSWGTLGLITEVSLKVLPIAPAQATLCFTELSQAQALQMLNQWGGQPLPLNASCWLKEGRTGTLYMRLCGAAAAVEAACRCMGGARVEPAQAAADWQACREQQLPWFTERMLGDCLWRLSVPQTAPALEMPPGIAQPLVEWHGALRWVQAPRSLGPHLQAMAQAVGGSATLFRAENAQQLRAQPASAVQSAALQRMHSQLKQAFDPAAVFNPGLTMA